MNLEQEQGGLLNKMVLVDTGLTLIRDIVNTDLSSGQSGISTYPADETQTGLLSAVATTLNTLESPKVNSGDTITVTHIVTTSEASGSRLSEWEVLGNTDATNYNRIVLSPLQKDSNTQINMIHAFIFTRI